MPQPSRNQRRSGGGGHPSGPSGGFRSAEERRQQSGGDQPWYRKFDDFAADAWRGLTQPGEPQDTAGGSLGQRAVLGSGKIGTALGAASGLFGSPSMPWYSGSDGGGGDEADPMDAYRDQFQGGTGVPAGEGHPTGMSTQSPFDGGPPMPQTPSGLAGGGSGATSMQDAWEQSAMIEQGYQQRLDQLRDMYRFSETPEEKAQIQFLLRDLEGQREAGHQIIDEVYSGAISGLEGRAGDMREAAASEGEDIAELYSGAASDLSGNLAQIDESYQGNQMSVGAQELSGDATDQVAALNEAAPREAALSQRMGNIAADDMSWLASTMGAEEGAQQGELERTAMQLAAQARLDHSRRVQDRTAQERMQFANQAGSLASQGLQQRGQMSRQLMSNPQQGMSPADQWMVDRADAVHDAQLQAWLDREGVKTQQQFGGQEAEAAVPTTPGEQMAWMGQMLTQNPQMAAAYVESNMVFPEVLEAYGIDPSDPAASVAPQAP